MNKKIRNSFWMMAIATASLAMSMTACSSDDNEVNNPQGEERQQTLAGLRAYAVLPTGTRGSDGALFTDDDIEWFNVTTREIRFRDTMEPLREKIPLLAGVDFYLNGENLFSGGATHVGLICSQMFDDLVLCCGKIDGEVIDDGHYYLYDCYPLQFINDERVKANRMKRAAQWELFITYLDGKGKLRK